MTRQATARVFLLITDAGGGHRAVASSLVEWARRAGKPWDIRIVNFYREMLQGEEPVKRLLGFYGEDAYNVILKQQIRQPVPLLQRLTAIAVHIPHPRARRAAAEFLAREQPDLTVSLMPFVNDECARLHGEAGVPFGIVCTDVADIEPRMWFTPGAMAGAAFVCVGSAEAARQAREAGAGDRVRETGLIVHPRFFDGETRQLSAAEARCRLGLNPLTFTVAILMGGYGGTSIRTLVRHLEGLESPCQIVACCGHNDRLCREIERVAATSRNDILALGFTTEIPAIMRAADVLIAKPGTTTLMEALTVGVPLVLDAVRTMPQERPNLAWAEAQECAVRLRRHADVAQVVRQLQADPSLGAAMRQRQQALAAQPAGPRVLDIMEACLGGTDRT